MPNEILITKKEAESYFTKIFDYLEQKNLFENELVLKSFNILKEEISNPKLIQTKLTL